MIEFDSQIFKMYSSLEKLESLDKHYYKKENYKMRDNRLLLRSDLIDSDNLRIFNLTSKNILQLMKRDLFTLDMYDKLYDRVGVLNVVTSYRLVDSFRKKTTRLDKRIRRIIENDNIFFLTFTFDDNKLRKKDITKYKIKTLRDYVTKWLKEYCNDYVGNIDFGGKNGRLHFHCVVSSYDEKIIGNTWRYGALNFEKIGKKNSKKLSLYVNKLCSHALKESTKAQYLIYPKKI